MSLVEADGPAEGPGRVQADPVAPRAAELRLGGLEQLFRHPAPLPVGEDRHPPEVTFPLADEVARDRPDDLAGSRRRDEHGRPQILCSFYPGELARPTPPGLDVASALVLSPADARALARELERAAEEAEEQ